MIQNDPSQGKSPFRWTPKQLAAVPLVADGQMTDAEIAARVGVKRAAVVRWRRRPEFAARVAALVGRAADAADRAAILAKAGRLEIYQRRHDAIDGIIAARAEQYKEVPGGSTGLLVAEPLIVKVYEAAAVDAGGDETGLVTPLRQSHVVYTYKVDTALLRESRELLKQVAIEMRQWVERTENTNRDVPPRLDLSKLSDDELSELERLTAKAEAGEGEGE